MQPSPIVAAALAAGLTAASAADVTGSADHPLVPRYEGSEIMRYSAGVFAEHRIMVAPARASGGQAKNLEQTLALEGRLTRIVYRGPPGRTSVEVFRNYETALAAAGFTPVFACAGEACGGRTFNHAVTTDQSLRESQQDQRYLAAKLARGEGDVYAALYVAANRGGGPDRGRAMVQLDVVELKPMEQRMVVLDAAALERDISTEGRVALYGLLFDFDKDTMRPDSRPQLDEIVKLLKGAPRLKVMIVGHSDAQGRIDYNRDLSERRSRSIVDALVGEHGIDRARLTAVGVGMAAPVASNRTEQGRARNRRVELVDLGT